MIGIENGSLGSVERLSSLLRVVQSFLGLLAELVTREWKYSRRAVEIKAETILAWLLKLARLIGDRLLR